MNQTRSDTDLLLALEAYVPPHIRWRLAKDPSLQTAPIEDCYPAAIIHVDVAGFTAMAEQSAAEGAAGAEQVGQTLSRFFHDLGAIVAAYGGYTLTFAGDSATAMWPAWSADTSAAVRLALQCGLELRARLDGLKIRDGAAALRIHLTVAAGEVRAAGVGGVNERWLPVVSGDPFDQVWDAQRHSAAGCILATPSAWRLVAEHFLGHTLPDGTVTITSARGATIAPAPRAGLSHVPSSAHTALRSYVPRNVQARLDSGGVDWVAEFRHATVAFIHARDLPALPAGDASVLQSFAHPIQAAVFAAGGSVNKVLAERRGLTVVAAWGLSQHAYEDNAVRAVRASLRCVQRLQPLGLTASIGVATGRIFIGAAGTDDHKEYALLGDVVNVAARLAHDGSPGVRCDGVTRGEARSRVLFEPARQMKLRGRADPVTVYRPLSEKPVQRDRDLLIGRDVERAQLRDALDSLESGGQGSVIMLEGEPGIGKSRLAADMVIQTQQRPVQSLIGWGESMECATAYHGWRDVFNRLFRLDAVSNRLAQRATVLEMLRTPERQARVALTNVVLPLDFPETPETEALRPTARAKATRELLVHLFTQAAGSRPTVVVLEDAHWMDSASWALAYDLAHAQLPLLMVIVARPVQGELMAPDWRSLRESERTTRMRLESLSPGEALALACLRLDCDSLPPPVAERVIQIAEGHPFFTEQLVLAMRDKDAVIRVEGGECQMLGELSAVSFATTVHALIDSRIDGLTVQQQDTLKVAAVLRRRFDVWTLRAAHPGTPDAAELQKQLDTLVELELLRVDSAASGRTYRFKHAITHEAVSGWLLPSERRNLNARVARMLEEQHPADLTPVHARLAHHWREAGVVSKAIDYLELAAQRALKEDANQEALVFLEQALELGRSAPTEAGIDIRVALWKRHSAEASWVMGDVSRAKAYVADALLTLRRRPRKPGMELATQLLVSAGQAVLPRRLLVVTDPPVRHHLIEASRVAALSAIIHTDPVDLVGAFAGGLLSHNLAARAGSANVHSLAMLAYAAGLIKMRGLSNTYFARMRREAQAQNDLRPLLFGLLLEAMKLFSEGRIVDSERCVREGLEWAGHAGNQRDRARLLMLGGATTCYSGPMAAGLAQVREAYDLAKYENEASVERTYSLLCLGVAYSQHLPPEQAYEVFGDLRRLLRESVNHDRLADGVTQNHLRAATAAALEALIAVRARRLNEALTSVQDALAFLDVPRNLLAVHPTGWILIQGPLETLWAALDAVADGRSDLASKVTEDARRFSKTLSRFAWLHPVYRPRALLFRGRVEWMRGRAWTARSLWRQSLERSDALVAAQGPIAQGDEPFMFDRALALAALGREETDHVRRGELLRRALTLFSRCRMPCFEEQVQTLLAAMPDAAEVHV